MATQRSAARGKSAKGAARPAAGRGSAKTSTPPPKRPAPSQTSGKKAPAGKPVPPGAAPSGKPAKSGPSRTGAGKSVPGKPAPGKSVPGKSAPGKGVAPPSAAASKKGAPAAGKPAGGKPTAGKQAVATPAASSTRPRSGPPARSEPVSKSGPAPKTAPPSKAGSAKAAPPSRAGAPAKAAPPSKASQLTKPAPAKGPTPPRATVGGRPLRPKLPKSDLGGDETIVLVPARTSDGAGPKGAAAAPARAGGRSGSERAAVSSTSRAAATVVTPVLPLPIRKRDEPMSLEERAEAIERRLAAQSDEFRQRYWDTFYMSWIYHDSALEGVVYTVDELRAALGSPTSAATGGATGGSAPTAAAPAAAGSASTPPPPPPSSGSIPPAPSSSPGDDGALETNIQPACEEIRRHREAIDYIRDYAKKKGPITVDVIRKIFLILHPEEGDLKSVKYRRDIPQHRLYFHEYEQPDKIAHKVRGVVDWLNDPETKKGRNGLRISARAHYDLLRVFPFQSDSGKVSRLFMNLLLLRSGLPPSIILSAERQRYYDALKGSANQILTMVQESVEVALQSIERLLDEHDAKSRPPSPL